MPGPVEQWTTTSVVVVAVLAVLVAATALAMLALHGRVGVQRRRRLGVDPEGRYARPWDLMPLWVSRPRPGRISLGWVGQRPPRMSPSPARETGTGRARNDPPHPATDVAGPASVVLTPVEVRRPIRAAATVILLWRVVLRAVRRGSSGLIAVAALVRPGGRLVATEDPRVGLDQAAVPWVARRWARSRASQRGSVIVLGPSQCGKTAALAIPAILEWAGPVIALSVKSDLMGATIARRRQLGEVRIFDPAGVTGETGDVWSPLREAATLPGARRAARSIANATAWTQHAGDLTFWADAGEDLLAQLFWVAANTGQAIDRVVHWVLTTDKTEVQACCKPLADQTDARVAAEGRQVLDSLNAVWNSDPKQVSSIYLTARQMIRPWQEPSVQASAIQPAHTGQAGQIGGDGGGHEIDLDWLLTPAAPELDSDPDPVTGRSSARGGNTVYLCADLDEAERLAPVLGGLVEDLLKQAYARVAATNTPLDPGLLVVIDEAGNWPMRSLPGRISTCAGQGIQLMLVFQSKAQIDAAYDRQVDVVISNAITKVFFSGLSDESTLRYASHLLGDEHVASYSTSTDSNGLLGLSSLLGDGSGRRSRSVQPTRVDLLPASLLRQVRPGQALLVHNTLRPAHLHGRYWFREPDLYQLATGERATRRTLARRAGTHPSPSAGSARRTPPPRAARDVSGAPASSHRPFRIPRQRGGAQDGQQGGGGPGDVGDSGGGAGWGRR